MAAEGCVLNREFDTEGLDWLNEVKYLPANGALGDNAPQLCPVKLSFSLRNTEFTEELP